MAATNSSKRAVFQSIVDTDEKHWPYYRCPSKEYAADDLNALKHDVSTLAREWFQHDAYEAVEAFICACPLAYFDFSSYDAYPDWHAHPKPVVPMLRALMLMHLHGWDHETALVTYLDEREGFADALGFESVPNQTTLWRARHERFSRDLRRAIKQCADFVRIHAAWNRVAVPETMGTAENDGASRRGPSEEVEGPSQKEVLILAVAVGRSARAVAVHRGVRARSTRDCERCVDAGEKANRSRIGLRFARRARSFVSDGYLDSD